jgi:hypothetical protein
MLFSLIRACAKFFSLHTFLSSEAQVMDIGKKDAWLLIRIPSSRS